MRELTNLRQDIKNGRGMDACKFDSLPISTIFKCVCKNFQFLFTKPHNAVFMGRNVPIAIFILDATADSMTIMSKATINCARCKQSADGRKVHLLLTRAINILTIFGFMMHFCKKRKLILVLKVIAQMVVDDTAQRLPLGVVIGAFRVQQSHKAIIGKLIKTIFQHALVEIGLLSFQ